VLCGVMVGGRRARSQQFQDDANQGINRAKP